MVKDVYEQLCSSLGLQLQPSDTTGCGRYFKGDNNRCQGEFWYYPYQDMFLVAKCDLVLKEDARLIVRDSTDYIALRLDYGRHLEPGKVVSYLEESEHSHIFLEKDTRLAYTEVLYSSNFYKKHFDSAFRSPSVSPLTILKSMGANHSWSSDISKILTDIRHSDRPSIAAELFYIGKSCELMSALIKMGTERLPMKSSDYEDIQRVIEYINQHYREGISQSDLVSHVNMSPTKLKSSFRHFTGQTITEYIISIKMDRASHMLADTDMRIDEVAKHLGFETASGFSTSFKNRMGICPSCYRKYFQFRLIKGIEEPVEGE